MSATTELEDHIMFLNKQKAMLRDALIRAIHGSRFWKEDARKALEATAYRWTRKS